MAGMFQITGLASGLDTKGMIQQLLALEKQPILSLQVREAKLEGVKTLLKDLNLKLTTLRDRALALTLNSNILGKTATLDTPSGQKPIIDVVATADAAIGSFKVWVDRLASGTKVASTDAIGQAIDATATLANAGFLNAATSGTFSINGTQITIDASVDTLNDVIGRINSSGAGVTASLANDSLGRPNLLKLSSTGTIQVGAAGDTSNFLVVSRLVTAPQAPDTAAALTGAAVGSGQVRNVTFALSSTQLPAGVQISVDQNNGSFSSQENAQFIVDAINTQGAGLGVTASTVDLGGGSFGVKILQNQSGKDYAVTLSSLAGTDAAKTGLSAGTATGTDKMVSTANLGVVQTTATLQNARLATALSASTGSFKINGVEFTYDAAVDSIASLVNKINSSAANVTAMYNSSTDKLDITSKTTGSIAMSLQDVSGNFLAATGVLSATQTLGQNALYRIDTLNGGVQQTSTSNTLTNVLPGISITLKQQSADPVTVSIGADTAKAAQTVKDFITAFNDVVDVIEKNITYDSKTKKAGPLLGDSLVQGITSRMRMTLLGLASGSTGTYKSLADIGINTGAYTNLLDSTKKLQLNESKLTEALQKDPGSVATLLGVGSTTTGAINNLRTYLGSLTGVGGQLDAKINSTSTQITTIEKSIARIEGQLVLRQKTLEAKFTSLETALAKLQVQGAQIAGQAARMNASTQ